MKRRSLRTLSLTLTAAMVMSAANPGITVRAASEQGSVTEQQAEVTTSEKETTQQVSEETVTESLITETATVDSSTEEDTAQVATEDVTEIVTTENVTEAQDAEETPVENVTDEKLKTKLATASPTSLASTVITNQTLLQMVVEEYNKGTGKNLTTDTMTVSDLSVYEGELDFSSATPSQINAVTDVKGLGIAAKASKIDISAFTKVTTIEANEFAGCAFTTFNLPDSITNISDSAFDSCTKLTSITLPTGLKQIGEAAFNKCSSMTSINTGTTENTLPEGLTFVGQKSFMDNTSLKEMNIPSFANGSVIESAVGLFSGCTKLEKITFGNNVKTIPVDAFRSAGKEGNGVTISFNAGLDKILNEAFRGAKLSDSTIDLSVCTKLTGIAAGAFREVDNLTEVIMADSVSGKVEFGEYVFAKTNLTSLYPKGTTYDGIYLPDYTAAQLGRGAFYGNTVMTAVSLPAGLGIIPDYAFDGCTSLVKVEQRGTSDVTLIGDCAFRKTAITNTDFMLKMPKLEQIGRQIHEKYNTIGRANEIESIPEGGVNTDTRKQLDISDITQKKYNNKYVGSEVFTGCNALENVAIPSSVKVIAQRAFYFGKIGDSSIANVTWGSVGTGTSGTERKIYPEAFYNNVNNQKIVLPENANETLSIGASAFCNNESLTAIGEQGSNNNTLPNTVSYIGVGAFMNCSALPEVHIQTVNGGEPELCWQVFEGCWSLKTATLPEQTTIIPKHFFGECPLTSFNFEDMDNLITIDTLAFLGNQFTAIDLSACTKLQEIGGCAFAFVDCMKKNTYGFSTNYLLTPAADSSLLTSVTLPDQVSGTLFFNTAPFNGDAVFTTMGRKGNISSGKIIIPSYTRTPSKSLFAYTGVSNVTWEADTDNTAEANQWKNLPEETFEGCGNVHDVKDVLPKYVENIGKRAFAASGITTADLTGFKNLTNISSGSLDYSSQYRGAFSQCSSLATVALPVDTAKDLTIDIETFKGSEQLNSLDLGGAVSLGEGAVSECTGLQTIDLKSVRKVDKKAFEKCTGLKSIDFGVVETIGDEAFKECTSLGEVTFGSSLTTIGRAAFQKAGVTKLDFKGAKSLTTINDNAFEGVSLKEFELSGTKVKVIPRCMLQSCESLQSATFGEEVEYISENALAGCPKFKDFTFYASTTVSQDVFKAVPRVNNVELITGANNGVSTGNTNQITISVKTPKETIIPLDRETAFPYYVNEEGKSHIKYLRIYDANSREDLTVEKYLSVKAQVEDGYYKVVNSNDDGDKYKVDETYFTKLDKAEVMTVANKKVDTVKVSGLEEAEAARNLKFEIVADIQFNCDKKDVIIQSSSFAATYNVKVEDAKTSVKLYRDNQYTQEIPVTDKIQAVDTRKGVFQCYYDLFDELETGSQPESYNITIETSNPDVLYAGESSNAAKKDSYTTKATTVNSSTGVATTNNANKRFYLIPSGVGTATITVYPELSNEKSKERCKKTFTFTVGSDVQNISLAVPSEYASKLYQGSTFSVFKQYTNYFGNKCTVDDMSTFNSYTDRTIQFTSSDPDYVSVDQQGNVRILKADTGTKYVTVTASSVGTDGKVTTGTVRIGIRSSGVKPDDKTTEATKKPDVKPDNKTTEAPQNLDVKQNEEVVDAVTGAKVIVTKVSKIDLQGEVKYLKPADTKAADVVIPDMVTINGVKYKVTAVSAGAFKNNKTVKTIKVGQYINTIEKEAFYGCSAMVKITIGDAVEKIDTKAFYNCTKLKTVTISTKSKLKKIGNSAFYNCKKLTKITVPSKVTSIGSKAFYNCKALKSITIKSSVLSSVGKQAFKNIHKKAVIKVPKKKLSAYKKLLKGKGQKKTVKIKK